METPRSRDNSGIDRSRIEHIVIKDELLKMISPLFDETLVILSVDDFAPLFMCDQFKHEFDRFGIHNVLDILEHKCSQTELSKFSMILIHQGIKYDYQVRKVDVLYQNKRSILFIMSKSTAIQSGLSAYEKITQVSMALLKLNNTIDIGDDIGKTLSLVLTEAIKVFENGHFGAVFVVQGNTFKIISNIGYSSDIDNFILPITDSFLYQSTNGKMDDLVMINDLRTNFKIYPIKSNTGEISMIKSSIVAPIFYKDSLYGTLGIDSNQLNATTKTI